MTRKNEASPTDNFPTYKEIIDEIEKLKAKAESHKRASQAGNHTISDILDYLGRLEHKLKPQADDHCSIRYRVLKDRLADVKNLIAAVQRSKEEKSDAPIILCYHLIKTKHVKYGWLDIGEFSFSIKSSFSQMREGLIDIIVPEHNCIFTGKSIVNPVMLPTGHVYEQAEIIKYLKQNKVRCPYTGNKLTVKDLINVNFPSSQKKINLTSDLPKLFSLSRRIVFTFLRSTSDDEVESKQVSNDMDKFKPRAYYGSDDAALIFRSPKSLESLRHDAEKYRGDEKGKEAQDLLDIMDQKSEDGTSPSLEQALVILNDNRVASTQLKDFKKNEGLAPLPDDLKGMLHTYLYDYSYIFDYEELVKNFRDNKLPKGIIDPLGELLKHCIWELRGTKHRDNVIRLADQIIIHLNDYLRDKINAKKLLERSMECYQDAKEKGVFEDNSYSFEIKVRKVLLAVFYFLTAGIGIALKGAYSYTTTGKFTIFNDTTRTERQANKVIEGINSMFKTEILPLFENSDITDSLTPH